MKHTTGQLFDPTDTATTPMHPSVGALEGLMGQLAEIATDQVRRPREATALLVRDLRARTTCWSHVRDEAAPGALRDGADEAAAALDRAIDAFAEASANLETHRRASASAQRARAVRERARVVRSGVVLLVRHALDISREEAAALCGASEARGHGVIATELEHLQTWLPANSGVLGETPGALEPVLERIANSLVELRESDPSVSGAFELVVDPDLRDRAWTWATRCAEAFTLRVNLCFDWAPSMARRFRSPLRRARYEDRLRRSGDRRPRRP